MKKKYCFWAAVALTALVGHGCGQPLSMNIKIKTDNLNYNFNTQIANFDIFSLLSTKFVTDKFDIDEYFKKIMREKPNIKTIGLYDMVNYPGAAQALLAAVQLDLLESFNFSDYLQDFDFELASQPINTDPITLPKFSIKKIDKEIFWFSMMDLFHDMEEIINRTSTPHFNLIENGTLITVPNIPLPPPEDFPHFMVENTEDGSINFDAVVVASGAVELIITATASNPAALGNATASITLNSIQLVDAKNDNGIEVGASQIQSATLNAGNEYSTKVSVNLAGAHISKDNPPVFKIGSAAATCNGMVNGFTLSIQPQLAGVTLRGADGLRIGKMTCDLPSEITDALTLALPAGFVNANIGEGTLGIGINLPSKGSDWDQKTTFITGAKIEYALAIEQAPVTVNGNPFPGLNETIDPDNPFIDLGNGDKFINGDGNINVRNKTGNIDKTTVTISTDNANGGAYFQLWDNDKYHAPNGVNAYTHRSLPVEIDLNMEIKRLDVVRWRTDTDDDGKDDLISIPTIPAINFGNMDGSDISNFITSINFEAITVNVDFPNGGLPALLQDRLAVKLICPELGFSDNTYRELDEKNEFIGLQGSLTLKENGKPKEISPLFELVPNVLSNPANINSSKVANPNAGYIELGPLTFEEGKTLKILGEVSFDFNWESANIDLKKILEANGGADAKALKGEFPIGDLSEAANFMGGLMFSEIYMQIVLGGPQEIIEMLDLKFTLKAEYLKLGDDGWIPPLPPYPPLVEEELHAVNAGSLGSVVSSRLDKNNNKIYIPADLPNIPEALNITNFSRVLEDFPKDLKFNYEMTLPDSVKIVHKTMFDFDDGDSAIKALLLIRLPLVLEAVTEDAGFKLSGVFAEGEDILGRKIKMVRRVPTLEKDIFENINIKQVALTIEFDGNIFGEAYLHIDKDKRVFGKDGLLLMPDGSKNFTVAINSNDFEIIRNNPIYPDVRITFKKDSIVTIPKNPLPTRISFSASGDYMFKLDL